MGELKKVGIGGTENTITPLTAGEGITITGKAISVDTTVIAEKSLVGDLSELDTTDKSSIVAAINEILGS